MQSIEERKAKKKEYRERPEVKARRIVLEKNPEYKAKAKERQKKPENIARAKELASSPEYKAKAKERREKPENRLREKERRLIPENIAKDRARRQRPEVKTKKKKYIADVRFKVLQYYSERLSNSNIPCCRCCGENSHVDFLALDHIAGKHKMNYEPELIKLGYSSKFLGSSLYKWIEDSDFPDGFQVLCANCNFAKGMKKNKNKCPHERK